MKTFIVIILIIVLAHAAVHAQYNMTPPIPQNYNSQMYYPQYQNLNYRNNNQLDYGYNGRYKSRLGYYYGNGGQEIRILRTVNDILQTAGIAYLVISDINDHSTKSENTVRAIPISRLVTLNTGQVVTQHGYRINGQDYYQ